jgi:hypothetical protein
VIGGAGLSAVFALAYLSSGSTAAGRSAVTIYMALMGVLTYWMIQGIDVVQPQTLAGRWQMFWLGLLLGALTIALPFAIPFIPFLSPDIFDGFTGPSLPMWGAIIGIFALSVLLCSVVMRTRQILGSVWYLSDPK